ncbi:hypothetical protein QQM39_38880 [Streptomyces sp. DT2A-34]|uniref:hypothetical protein n=1 Tax=Streptomyces sp. DT2A-34 TaxID=3051182 RepID=UPI00265C7A68|nr:hypothetical protein [Streptomyces sp. DT2A-34]MDO0916577.1 hypothetical protein [Streptomyces sp. DT2A-34]
MDGTRDTGALGTDPFGNDPVGADPFGNVVLLVGGFDERETGLMPVRPPPAPVGKVTPPAPTVDVLGGVAPLPLLFNRSDGIGVGELSSGAALPPAALLRWFAELVRNGSTGLTGPVVGEVPPPPAEGLEARETGLMVLVSGGVLPLPPLFRKVDGIRDGVPTVGDAVVLGLLVLGAVGNVLVGTEPGLRAACIAGFSFPGFSCVGDSGDDRVVDGVVDGSGEFTGAEANFVGLIGVLLGNVIRVGVGTGAFVGEFTREFAGPFTGAEVNLVGVTGVLVGKVIRVGVVTGRFTGAFTGRFPRRVGGLTGEFTGELTGFLTGVVTGGVFGSVVRGVVFGSVMRGVVGGFIWGPGPRVRGGVVTPGMAVLGCGSLDGSGGVRFGLVPLSGDVMFVVET